MTKLKHFAEVDIDKIPEEILEKIHDLNKKISEFIIINKFYEDPNILLASFGRVYGAFIKKLVSDDVDHQVKAACLYAKLLMKTVVALNNFTDDQVAEIIKNYGV